MEKAYEILDFLPIRFKQTNEQEYIEFLWDSFQSNYENEKFQFAFIAYHMLFMSVVYFNIWQIKTVRPSDFEKIRLGFNEDIGNATSPFSFSKENERKIFDLLKYLCASHSDVKTLIGQYKKLVDERNDIAHASGNMPFRSESYLAKRITDIVRYSHEIQAYSRPVIHECFEKFLIDSQDEDTRQYLDRGEQINEVLIHEHYLSKMDLKFCFEYDIRRLSSQPNYEEIKLVFASLEELYGEIVVSD